VQRIITLLVLLALTATARAEEPAEIRVATFNVHDIRSDEIRDPNSPRLKQLAEIIQRIRPDVLLINEIAYDMPGAPGVPEGADPGQNAELFVKNFLAVAQADDVEPLSYNVFMGPTNTGMPSGFDLNNDGRVITRYPNPPGGRGGRDYGGDTWGYGTFPGQYGMALLVDEQLEIVEDDIRTFRLMPWRYMPGALIPPSITEEDANFYDDEELELFRLSSKAHWDIPVRLPNGAVVHMLASHPTPPAFDGPEERNKRRNHDEIRFWADYLSHADYIVDDNSNPAALPFDASFVVLGDLNADPEEGSSYNDPIGTILFTAPGVNPDVTPTSDIEVEGLDAHTTSHFGLRVDYVVPSNDLEVLGSGIWRADPAGAAEFPSDHYPVWVDLRVPAP